MKQIESEIYQVLFFVIILILILSALIIIKKIIKKKILKYKNSKSKKENNIIIKNGGVNKRDIEKDENKNWEFKSFRGDISEKNTVMQIKEMSKLPIIQNPIITGYNGYTSEIDIVMINEYGVFVFENKSYSGRIIGKQRELKWTQVIDLKKIKFYNPIMQNEKHIKVLKNKLKTNTKTPYFNVIVFGGSIDISDIEYDNEILLTTRASIKVELNKLMNKSRKILNDIEQRSIHRKIIDISKFDKESREKHIEQVKKFVEKKQNTMQTD